VRFLYNLLTYLLLLPYTVFWFLRAAMNAEFRPNICQRFGFGHPRFDSCIWIHAVSVGEVVAAVPLVRALIKRYPHIPVMVTTVTPTGAARVRATFGDDVRHSYIPFEMPACINAFFRTSNPIIALIMETEIWPNLYQGCGVRNIPLVLVSARISPKSVDSYRKLLPLFRETLSHGIVIAAQSEDDAERFLSLGASAERTRVTGNIKFDIDLPDGLAEQGIELRDQLFPGRPVWIAASTHDMEEAQLLDAHESLLQRYPDLLLILVPRHPNRFSTVRALLQKRGFDTVTRTEGHPCDPGTKVFLGDTMGEVPLFYAASDIAFVGGSLVPIGGHNLLEPAALGVPIITGPHVFNAQDVADRFSRQDASRMVNDSLQLAGAVDELLSDPAGSRELGQRGLQILNRSRGALRRLLAVIEPLLRAESRP
jgi:3-deoxy-D-manno-octulosonic-acid transferase